MFCTGCGKEISNNAVICVHCGVPAKSFIQPQMQIQTVEKPVEAQAVKNKKVEPISLSGFIIAVASIVLGFLSVYINRWCYTGVNFQFFFALPLIASLVLSIIGTVRAKKAKSGASLGFGIAGIVISGGFFLLFMAYIFLLLLSVYAFTALFLFILALL